MYLYQLLNGPNICCVLILYVTLSHLVCGCCCGICRLTTIFLSNMFPNTFSLTCCILICFLDQIPQLKGTLTKTFENLQSCIYVITFLHSHKNLSNIQSNIKVYSFITGKLPSDKNCFDYFETKTYSITVFIIPIKSMNRLVLKSKMKSCQINPSKVLTTL